MRFSSNFGTAIHTLLIISEVSKTQKVTSDVIADHLGMNPVLVRNLLGVLKKVGFISIAPRKDKAGTTLARPLCQITLFDVFEAVEPNCLQDLNKSSTRLAKRSHTGIFANEIIFEYVRIAVDAVRDEYSKITLADALAALEIKESESPYDNPRALFHAENQKS